MVELVELRVLLVSEFDGVNDIFGGGEHSVRELATALSRSHDVTLVAGRFSNKRYFTSKREYQVLLPWLAGNPRNLLGFVQRARSVRACRSWLRAHHHAFDRIIFVSSLMARAAIPAIKQKSSMVVNGASLFCPKGSLWYKDKEACGGCSGFSKMVGCFLQSSLLGQVRFRWWLKYNPFFWLLEWLSVLQMRKAANSIGSFVVYNELLKGIAEQYGKTVLGCGIYSYPLQKPLFPVTFTILVGGVVEPHKGVEIVVRAYNELYAQNKEVRLVIAGNGSQKEYLQRIAQGNVKFLGKMSHDHFLRFMREQASVVVIPSLWAEPLPRIGIEALAMGKPVIVSNVGGNSRLVDNAVNGMLFRPNDVQDLMMSLEFVRNDDYKKMGQKSQELFKTRFSPEKMIAEWKKILK